MLFIFDWDGTVLNSIDKIVLSMQAAAEEFGVEQLGYDHAKSIIGLALPVAIETLFPEMTAEQRDLLQQSYSKHYIERDQAPCDYYPHALETIQALKAQGHQLAVATGKSRRGLDRVLASLGMSEFFDTTRCADETKSKPNPLMLQEILEELNCSVDQAIMIGDTSFDLEMAKNINMRRIGVSYGAHPLDRLKPCEPEMILDDLRGLLQIAS